MELKLIFDRDTGENVSARFLWVPKSLYFQGFYAASVKIFRWCQFLNTPFGGQILTSEKNTVNLQHISGMVPLNYQIW